MRDDRWHVGGGTTAQSAFIPTGVGGMVGETDVADEVPCGMNHQSLVLPDRVLELIVPILVEVGRDHVEDATPVLGEILAPVSDP